MRRQLVALIDTNTFLDDTCTTVLEMNDIPFSLFYEWNPAIGLCKPRFMLPRHDD